MCGTLSHRTPSPRDVSALGLQRDSRDLAAATEFARQRIGRAVRALTCAASMVFALACNPLDDGSGSATEGTKLQAEGASSSPPFSWPRDPSHPVLEITIESPETSGTLLIELMPELAPATVVNVIELANDGYYDGTTFHRVVPGFMIQGGDPNSRDRDPTNDGKGASGRPLHDEFGPTPFIRGVVGMGNKGRENSTSTQFFIMQTDNENLDGRYTAIGRVLSGMALVDEITRAAIDRTGRWGPKDRPIENVVMTTVRTVGQVSAIRYASKLDGQTRESTQLASAVLENSGTKASIQASSWTATGQDDEWERLEASGR